MCLGHILSIVYRTAIQNRQYYETEFYLSLFYSLIHCIKKTLSKNLNNCNANDSVALVYHGLMALNQAIAEGQKIVTALLGDSECI